MRYDRSKIIQRRLLVEGELEERLGAFYVNEEKQTGYKIFANYVKGRIEYFV